MKRTPTMIEIDLKARDALRRNRPLIEAAFAELERIRLMAIKLLADQHPPVTDMTAAQKPKDG